MFFLFSSNSCKMGLTWQGWRFQKKWKNGIRDNYLVHLDEKAVDKVSRVWGVKGCFIDLDPGCNEVLKFFYQVIEVVVTSWKILHDFPEHIIQLWAEERGVCVSHEHQGPDGPSSKVRELGSCGWSSGRAEITLNPITRYTEKKDQGQPKQQSALFH